METTEELSSGNADLTNSQPQETVRSDFADKTPESTAGEKIPVGKNGTGQTLPCKKRRRSMRTANLFIFCFLITLACAALRTMQVISGFVDEDGLYVAGKTIENAMPFWLLGVTLIGGFAISYAENRNTSHVFRKSVINTRQAELMVFAAIFAVLGLVYAYETAKSTDVASMLCSSGFIGAAVIIFMQKRIVPATGFLMVLPGIGYAISAISAFAKDYIITKTPVQLTLFLSNIVCAIFFLMLGRVFSRTDAKITRIKLAATGAAAVNAILSETLAYLFLGMYSETGEGFVLLPNLRLVLSTAAIVAALAVLSAKPHSRMHKSECD